MFKKWFSRKTEKPAEPAPAGDRPPSTPGTAAAAAPPASPEVPLPEEPDAAGEEASRKGGAFAFLRAGFAKTRAGLRSLFGLREKLDEATITRIEEELFTADFGPGMVERLIEGEDGLRAAWKSGRIQEQGEVLDFLKSKLKETLQEKDPTLQVAAAPPTVYLVAGVNGTGKTTSIAKLAYRLRQEGNTVLLAAADTFRAAAVEQLTIWSKRLGIGIVTGDSNSDPASVAFKGVERAKSDGIDCLIVDTAGRLHTDKNLMRELKKIRDVIARKVPGAPHEALLVLDSTVGQNAIQQAEIFNREIDITGIILTKLDGTAKGGVVFAIHERLDIPVKLVGIGEKLPDMTVFDPSSFVDALFDS